MLKRFFFLHSLVILIQSTHAQNVPELINYQGLARDASGQPLSGQSITVSFTIWQGSPGGTNVFTETHNNKTTNNFGLFDLKIGSINTSAFQSINWANGPFHLEVAINGNSLGIQQMVSVPYALYAKSAGNFNISPGTNVSISGGSIHATPSLSINGNTLSISGGNSVNLPSSGNTAWELNGNSITTGQFLGTTNNMPVLFASNNSTVMKLSSFTGTSGILGIGGAAMPSYTLQSLAHLVIPNSTFTSALRLGHGNQPDIEWHFDVDAISNLYLKNENNGSPIPVMTFSNNGRIGINNVNPLHQLHINLPAGSNFNALHATHAGTGVAAKFESNNFNNTHPAVEIVNNNNGPGIDLISSGPNHALQVIKTGTAGNGMFISVTNSNNIQSALNVNYLHKGIGINILCTNSLNTEPNLNINHEVSGPGIKVISSSTNDAIYIDKNSSSGNGIYFTLSNSFVGNGITMNHAGSAGQGILINKSGVGNGISINHSALNSNALNIIKSGIAGSAIYATSSSHSLSTIYSEKTGTIGAAGEFIVTNSISTSTNPAIIASVLSGGGDAIIAEVNPSVTNSKNSIILKTGHIKSISSSPPSFGTHTVSGGFSSPTSLSMGSSNTDVKGTISFSVGATGFSTNNFVKIRINFFKPYVITPVVVITPSANTDLQGLTYRVETDLTGFYIVIYRPVNMTVPTSLNNSLFNFNYFVIE